MKKVFFLLAVAGMFSFAACNNAAEAPAEDTVAPVEQVVEEVVDSTAATVEAAAEEVVEAATEVVNQ